jgi:hypothetical protein
MLAAARLLGGDGVASLLSAAAEATGAGVASWTRRSLHRRGTSSVSGVYEVELVGPDWTRSVLLVAHVDREGPHPDALEVTDGELRVAMWRFPMDPYMPGLPSAVHRGRVRELLDRLAAPPGDVALRTRAYRPARRAVVEVVIDDEASRGRVLYLKVLAGDRADELAHVHRQLVSSLPVPQVLGVARAQGIVALETLPGRTLRSATVDGVDLPDPGQLLELSRRLAGSGLQARRDPVAFADPTRHVALLAELVPDQRSRLEEIAGAAREVTGPLVPVHGDLHDGQLLCQDGEVVGLLDVDGAGPGRLAHDAGSLVAHLEAIGDVWPDAADRAGDYAAAVADAYRSAVGDRALASATAGAWLGLATGPYRAQDEGWQEATRRRIVHGLGWARRATR